VSVVVPPQHRRTIGVVMEQGPITAIRPGSPADRAGFREGDTLLAINGQPLSDPMMLPDTIRPWQGKEIEIQVSRPGASEPITLTVTPVAPTTFDWDWAGMPKAPMSSEALGLAFSMSAVVKDIVPDSPAAQAGLQPGDKLVSLQAQWKSPNASRDASQLTAGGEKVKIDGELVTWPSVMQMVQYLDPEEVLAFQYERGNSGGTAIVSPEESSVFQPDRGFLFANYSEIHRAGSLGEAIQLGIRQTWEDATRVVGLLRKLVTGSVSVTNLGGLGTIAYVASSEASEGITRLLIFLTMLSANLAVLNFLPIPALDGGHMVFLIYEGLFRKPVNERVQVALTIFGVVCLLGLMIFVNAMDVRRFFF
jgi:regulator of sigma E protease